MKRNESTTDRLVRAVAALIACIAAYLVGGVRGTVLGIVGAVLALTAAVGFCPLYAPFGLNTCKR